MFFDFFKEQRNRKMQEKMKNEQRERERLAAMSEKELMTEMILRLKEVSAKCDDIVSNIIIYGN